MKNKVTVTFNIPMRKGETLEGGKSKLKKDVKGIIDAYEAVTLTEEYYRNVAVPTCIKVVVEEERGW